jgi:hypothetical protein
VTGSGLEFSGFIVDFRYKYTEGSEGRNRETGEETFEETWQEMIYCDSDKKSSMFHWLL